MGHEGRSQSPFLLYYYWQFMNFAHETRVCNLGQLFVTKVPSGSGRDLVHHKCRRQSTVHVHILQTGWIPSIGTPMLGSFGATILAASSCPAHYSSNPLLFSSNSAVSSAHHKLRYRRFYLFLPPSQKLSEKKSTAQYIIMNEPAELCNAVQRGTRSFGSSPQLYGFKSNNTHRKIDQDLLIRGREGNNYFARFDPLFQVVELAKCLKIIKLFPPLPW